MNIKPVRIGGWGNYYSAADDHPVELKSLVVEELESNVRRISRFIQLALIGVGRCARSCHFPHDTAIYLASDCGDIETAADVMDDMLKQDQEIKPLSFVNSVSNSACYYIAKCMKLRSQSCFISRIGSSFETALQLAWLDLQIGHVQSALVGSVDMVHHPLDLHCRRLKLPIGTQVGEGSHWLWLTTSNCQGPQLRAVEFFRDRQTCNGWLKSHGDEVKQVLVCREPLVRRAFYPTQAGAAIADFLESTLPQSDMIHIRSDDDGRAWLFRVSRR